MFLNHLSISKVCYFEPLLPLLLPQHFQNRRTIKTVIIFISLLITFWNFAHSTSVLLCIHTSKIYFATSLLVPPLHIDESRYNFNTIKRKDLQWATYACFTIAWVETGIIRRNWDYSYQLSLYLPNGLVDRNRRRIILVFKTV